MISELGFVNLFNLMVFYLNLILKLCSDVIVLVGLDFLWCNSCNDGVYVGLVGVLFVFYVLSCVIGIEFNLEVLW